MPLPNETKQNEKLMFVHKDVSIKALLLKNIIHIITGTVCLPNEAFLYVSVCVCVCSAYIFTKRETPSKLCQFFFVGQRCSCKIFYGGVTIHI